MKKVDAVWEKRNLGVSTTEVLFDAADDLGEVREFLRSFRDEYVVLKVPSFRPDLTDMIPDYRYKYVEDMMGLVSYLGNIERNPCQQRIYDSIQAEKMDDADVREMFAEVSGGMFDTDRVSLDPFFSREQATLRYVNWIKDEMERGTEFLKYVYKGQAVGFISIRELENRHYGAPFGGFYKDFQKKGLGSAVKVPEEVRKRGGKSVSTSVSSNNFPQIRNLVINGYVPESILHIFVKHW